MLLSVRSLLFRAEELPLTMKVYNLACEQNHRFEGWFSSEDDFLSQSAQQQIVCPVCDSFKVGKLPSAPHLNLSAAKPDSAAGASAGSGDARLSSPAVAQFQRRLQEMARHVMENTEDVGEGFTEEARRIHYGQSEAKAIRGQATREERDALADEGIEVFTLPSGLPPKSSLQ